MNKKLLLRLMLTGAVAFAATACGSQQVSDLGSATEQSKSPNSFGSEQKSESVLAFALACSPVKDDAALRSALLMFDGSLTELRLDARGSERIHSFISSQIATMTADTIDVSWPLDQVSFKASLVQGRIFNGELKQGNEVTAFNCYKIVTAERDSDEFSLACTPLTAGQAYVEGLDISIRDVVLSWEDRGLEMIVNPTSQSLIYDFERADGVEVNDQLISALWNLEHASFKAVLRDGNRFDGQLAYDGQSSVPLICWKL